MVEAQRLEEDDERAGVEAGHESIRDPFALIGSCRNYGNQTRVTRKISDRFVATRLCWSFSSRNVTSLAKNSREAL
jgi:hypothetical protein